MADVISAEEGALRQGAQAVNEAKSAIDLEMKQIRSEIEGLRSAWSGSAATAFQSLMTRWDEETKQLNEVLVSLEDSLRRTEQTQIATEESHQQTIAGLGSMMGG